MDKRIETRGIGLFGPGQATRDIYRSVILVQAPRNDRQCWLFYDWTAFAEATKLVKLLVRKEVSLARLIACLGERTESMDGLAEWILLAKMQISREYQVQYINIKQNVRFVTCIMLEKGLLGWQRYSFLLDEKIISFQRNFLFLIYWKYTETLVDFCHPIIQLFHSPLYSLCYATQLNLWITTKRKTVLH